MTWAQAERHRAEVAESVAAMQRLEEDAARRQRDLEGREAEAHRALAAQGERHEAHLRAAEEEIARAAEAARGAMAEAERREMDAKIKAKLEAQQSRFSEEIRGVLKEMAYVKAPSTPRGRRQGGANGASIADGRRFRWRD